MSRKPSTAKVPRTTIPALPELDRTGKVLQQALARMDNGRAWGTGRRRHQEFGRVKYCAWGAIDAATKNPLRRHRALKRLASALPGCVWANGKLSVGVVVAWNDRALSWRQIKEGFESAIEASYHG